MIRKHRSTAAAILGAAIIVSAATVATAQAKPAPAPQPYTLGQEIVSKVVTGPGVSAYNNQYLFTAEVDCPTGKVPTGGGSSMRPDIGPGPASPRLLEEDRPTATGWRVVWIVPDDRQATAEAYAVCVNAAPPTS